MIKKILILFVILSGIYCQSQEICDNAIDDDGDGLIDLNDSIDCFCKFDKSVVSSLIPNHSFEEKSACPKFIGQLVLADNWLQASTATSDYFNTCGLVTQLGIKPDPPVSNGTAYVGFYVGHNYKEYIGVCLNSPLLAGVSYTISFYTAHSMNEDVVDLGIFGTPNCTDLPWTGVKCPVGVGSWQTLGSTTVSYLSKGPWQQVSISFTPSVDINAIALGGVCGLNPVATNLSYYYIDELTLNETSKFGSITSTGFYCDSDLKLHENFDVIGNKLQWYLDGVALLGESKSSIDVMKYGLGNYSVVNYHKDSCGVSDFSVGIPKYPKANFISATGTCLSDKFTFINDTSKSYIRPKSWIWEIDDGSIPSTDFNYFHTFPKADTFNVRLITSTALHCRDTITKTIIVRPAPIAQFDLTINGNIVPINSGDTVVVCKNDILEFNNLSTIQPPYLIQSHNWDFGDGSSSTQKDETHVYTFTRYNKVIYTAKSDYGCEDTFSCMIRIVPNPISSFVSVKSICSNFPVAHSNTSIISSGQIIDYQWSFGDGDDSSLKNPIHNYTNGGLYNVELISYSDFNCMDTVISQVEIKDVPILDFDQNHNCQKQKIEFNNKSSIANGVISSWSWDFGDDSVSYDLNPIHYHQDYGVFNVKLVATSDNGCKDSLTVEQLIHPSPVVEIDLANICLNEKAHILNLSTISDGSIIGYNWNFGNDINSNVKDPDDYFYTNFGSYWVSLQVESDQGCLGLDSNNVDVFEMPIAIINNDELAGCNPFEVELSHGFDPNIFQCIWYFGDGITDPQLNTVNHEYSQGIFDVSLVVLSDKGCRDSIHKPELIEVFEQPVADFGYSPNKIDAVDKEVELHNLSKNSSYYEWEFNDGTPISTDLNIDHQYEWIGDWVEIKLTAINSNNSCFDEHIKRIPVDNPVVLYVPNSFTPNSQGSNDEFKPIVASGIDIYNYKLTVFNRWGEIIFISHDSNIGWTGTYLNKNLVSSGVYVWQIEYLVEANDLVEIQKGTVMVLY